MTTGRAVVGRPAPVVATLCLLGLTGAPSFAVPATGPPTCSPNGTALSIVALDGKFDKKCLAAPADQALTIDFKNLDRGLPHNVAIYRDQKAEKVLFRGALVPGPGVRTYSVPALPAGQWFFRCDPHPDMNGTFIVRNP